MARTRGGHGVPVDRVQRELDLGFEPFRERGIPEVVLLGQLGPDLLEEPDGIARVGLILLLERLVERGRMERVDTDRVRMQGPREAEPADVIRFGDREFTGEVPRGARPQVDAPDEDRPGDVARDDFEPVTARAQVAGWLRSAAGCGEDEEDEEQRWDSTADGSDRTSPPSMGSPR